MLLVCVMLCCLSRVSFRMLLEAKADLEAKDGFGVIHMPHSSPLPIQLLLEVGAVKHS